MIDFKNFKIKRGPSTDLHDPRLIIEEGCWYLSTDTAELFVGIIENGTPVLKPVNGELIPEVDLANYYTKSETYNKEEVDALLPAVKQEVINTVVPEVTEVKTKVEDVIIPTVQKVEKELEPTVAELKAWVDANNEIQDVILAKVGEDLNILENNVGFVKVDDRSLVEVIDETFAKKAEIPSFEGLATEDFVREEIKNSGHMTIADLQIGEDFTTDIKVGHLEAGFEVKSTMTFGELLKRILRCEHDWIDATCTTPKTCKLCGATEGEPLGHIEEILQGYAADCTNTGLTDGVKCSRCGEILVEQQIIPALGHKYISEVTLEPTCTTDGTRTYTCSNGCGETYTEVIPALDHNYVSEIIKPATCTEEGIRKYTCTRCGDTYEEVIPVIAHNQAIREENRVEPDCTNNGSYEKVTYCIECDEEISRETITLDALGHDPLPAVEENRVEPTTTSAGSYDSVVYCNRCGKELSRTTFEIPMLEPEEPNGVVEEIISKELPMYSIDYDGNVASKEFEIVTFNSREEANQVPTESCFYQVKDETGEIIESGYQDMQIANDGMYYIIALPKIVDYNSNMVKMQAYDDEEQLWVDYTKLPLTSDPEIVASCCDEVGVDISHIDQDLYTVWVNENICTGSRLRYIIEE